MNPASGLSHYWTNGDALTHLVAYALLFMSLLSWFWILSKATSAWRSRQAVAALTHFWEAPTMKEGLRFFTASDPEQLFSGLAVAALDVARATAPHTANGMDQAQQEGLHRALRRALLASTQKIERGQTILASIGATAPFVGLLGTVWGIYHALAAVSSAGTVQIDKVAGPVGEALIMTALGLAVAIPAVLAYNGFVRANRLISAELDGFAYDLQAALSRQPQTDSPLAHPKAHPKAH